MKSLPLLVMCLGLQACGGGGGHSDPPPLVVFMGDSLMQGWGAQGLYGTPIADPTLDQLVPGSINAGISGQTSVEMLARFQSDVLARHPGVVVILAGTNDIRKIPDATTDSVAQMADEAAQSGATVILGTIPDQEAWLYTDLLTQTTEPVVTQSWNASIRTLAAVQGYRVVDYYTALDAGGAQDLALFQDDGVHPDEAGYTQMWETLKPILDSVGVMTH